jgi:hypothetical protein
MKDVTAGDAGSGDGSSFEIRSLVTGNVGVLVVNAGSLPPPPPPQAARIKAHNDRGSPTHDRFVSAASRRGENLPILVMALPVTAASVHTATSSTLDHKDQQNVNIDDLI